MFVDSNSPGIGELARVLPTFPQESNEPSRGSEDLKAMVVLVRHKDSIVESVIGDSGGAVEESWTHAFPTKGRNPVPIWCVDDHFMVLTISHQHLK